MTKKEEDKAIARHALKLIRDGFGINAIRTIETEIKDGKIVETTKTYDLDKL